jgi:carboxymethylenebutenolidase
MGLHTEWINYGENGQYKGYLAHFDQLKTDAPAVIVIQEVWGVDAHIQDVTRRFGEAGYIAFSPDLYSKNGERQEVLKEERIGEVKQFLQSVPPTAWGNEEERKKILASFPEDKQQRINETMGTLFGGLDPENYMDQLTSTSDFLRKTHTNGKGVGAIGFCLGGALSAALAIQDPDLKGAIIFYGRPPQAESLKTINCPVVGFYGQNDPGITTKIPDFAKAMEENGKSFDYTVYEGAGHAFFNDSRVSYHAVAARDAFAKSLTFFNNVLK